MAMRLSCGTSGGWRKCGNAKYACGISTTSIADERIAMITIFSIDHQYGFSKPSTALRAP